MSYPSDQFSIDLNKTVLAWHFLCPGETLRTGDRAPKDGEWLIYKYRPSICQTGLHASSHPFDALKYAPSLTLCLVRCTKPTAVHEDKFVCQARQIVARRNVKPLILEMARMAVLSEVSRRSAHTDNVSQSLLDYLITGEKPRDYYRAADSYVGGTPQVSSILYHLGFDSDIDADGVVGMVRVRSILRNVIDMEAYRPYFKARQFFKESVEHEFSEYL